MNSNDCKMNLRTLSSCIVFVFFCLIAGASVEDIGTFFIIMIVAVPIAVIAAGINEYMKSQTRKEMESAMTDFKISKSFKISNDSAVYYDENQEKIRLVSIGASSYKNKDMDNVIVKNTIVCPSQMAPKGFFIITNAKDGSTILAKADSSNFNFSKIEQFETSNYVCTGTSSFFAVDKNNEKILAVDDEMHNRVVSYEDIIKVELIENGTTLTSKSTMRTLGGAALGGFIAGGAGMVVGGLSGKTTTVQEVNEIKVKILLRDIDNPEVSIIINRVRLHVKKDKEIYNQRKAEAQKIVDMVSVIIDQVDKKNKQSIAQDKNKEVPDISNIADELQKIVNLKERGILSEEEFNTLKSKLLNS